jgi:hypothetical protein
MPRRKPLGEIQHAASHLEKSIGIEATISELNRLQHTNTKCYEMPTKMKTDKIWRLKKDVRPLSVNEKSKKSSSYSRLLISLKRIYPCINDVEIQLYLGEIRSQNNGGLTGLSLPLIVRKVGQLMPSKS